jgi:hypothetical protein
MASLREDLEGPMLATVSDAGGQSVDGSTRRAVTQQIEDLWHKVITQALEQHPDRMARPVTVFPNFDKLSRAWILALPTATTGLKGRVFTEAMAAHLCLPSPAIREWLGESVGRHDKEIDLFGDAVMNCNDLAGDSWRIRHDTGKLAIVNECLHSKLPVECEVYGLFADNIPAEATADGEDLQWGRARQGLIPDLKICMPSPTGPTDTLAELKFISAGVTWYPRGVKGKGTDRRAAKLPGEYRRNLRKLDRRFHGTLRHQTDPLVQRLQSFGDLQGLVVGPWGDGSRNLHSLVKLLGEQRIISQAS